MSKIALSSYKEAREQRLGKNDARRIRGERDKACSSTSGANRRWPYELLQNAHDPGPRNGLSQIDLQFTVEDSRLIFRHNGLPFSLDDLAALLSGGSNKEYDSVKTSGRYGTGFLVTHVISTKIGLRGVISNRGQYERFQISLDRSGAEDDILRNIKEAEAGIEAADSIKTIEDLWSAEFDYPIDSINALQIGIDTLRASILFLLGTCQYLGQVKIETSDGHIKDWKPKKSTSSEYEGIIIQERKVTLMFDATPTEYKVLRLIPGGGEDVGLVVLLHDHGTQMEFIPAPIEMPRIFSRLPVRVSTFLPINCVIDGKFDVQEERDRIAMSDSDKRRIEAAMCLISTAVKYGLSQNWKNCHLLAHVSKVNSAFSETKDDDELKWWNNQLREVAKRLAQLPLVKTATEFLPAVPILAQQKHAHFVVPRYSKSSSADEVPEAQLWQLATATTVLNPPCQELVPEWNAISAGWHSLGIQVTRLGLKEIAEEIRKDARMLEDLPVHDDGRMWLAQYLTLIGHLPPGHDCVELVKGLLPNQNHSSVLCSPDRLKRDAGITSDVKDIADIINCSVRDRLLDEELAKRSPVKVIENLIPGELTEDEVLKECLEHLAIKFPDGCKVTDDLIALVDGSIRLLKFIWTSRGKAGGDFARRCPLLTKEGSIVHYSSKKIMAPVMAWPEQAHPFADIYAPGRILADKYCDPIAEWRDFVGALVAWEMAYPEPLVRAMRPEVKDTLLQQLTGDDVRGIIVRNEEFSQVALLSTEVIQRCQEDENRAALLLGFVLAYLAPRDQSWRGRKQLIGKREGNELTIEVCDALWIAELKSREWVTMKGEEGNKLIVPSATNLDPILKKCKQWLVGNEAAIEFLIKWFKFDVLKLRLEALPEDLKDNISTHLATLVQMGGSNTEFYQQVVENLEAQQQREIAKERNRQFGLAVQCAIQSYLTEQGLTVDVIDRGYDLDVEVPEDISLIEAGTHHCSIGPYHVEVKATTTGEVRLTPAQAKFASGDDDFVLCVVDLRGCEPKRLSEQWTAKDVEPVTRMVSGLRPIVNETHKLIEAAMEQEIVIRNEGKLRYGVPTEIWERGKSILSWVREIKHRLNSR